MTALTRIAAGALLLIAMNTSAAPSASRPEATEQAVRERMTRLPAHPRLLLTPETAASWQATIAADPQLKAAANRLVRSCEGILAQPPVERKMEGRRLLHVSRECLRRVGWLASAFRLTGDRRFCERAEREMLAAAAFSDWNPSHFLDVAEMTAALALGYDWLYDELPPTTRATLRSAIMEKGIGPSLIEQGNWWIRGGNNWNQVCHAGMALGALAIAEDEPELAVRIVTRAVDCLPHAMKQYAPDGAYPEGPVYWDYGTSFNVLLLAALESALETDFGLAQQPGFIESATYFMHMRGPTGKWFNYADCVESGGGISPALYWFAHRTGDPTLLWNEAPALEAWCTPSGTGGNRTLPLLLVYAAGRPTPQAPRALDWCGRGPSAVAVHRTSWIDHDAVFVGIKAGTAAASHGHMDAGSFVLDAGGVRWALDFGMQDYHSLESKGIALWSRGQDAERWRIFRLGSLSHNTLVVDGQLQNESGYAAIVENGDAPDAHTVVDLGDVYKGQLASARRSVALRADGVVLIEDTLQAPADRACRVRWGMVTRADVQLDGSARAALTQDGRALDATAEGLDATAWEIYPTDPPPASYDAPNPGTRMLGFTVALSAGETRVLRVRFALQPR
jgi:hypothetical protein